MDKYVLLALEEDRNNSKLKDKLIHNMCQELEIYLQDKFTR